MNARKPCRRHGVSGRGKRDDTATIELINGTGVLHAVKDGYTHISVYPLGGTIEDWRNQGVNSIWTQALLSVCTKY